LALPRTPGGRLSMGVMLSTLCQVCYGVTLMVNMLWATAIMKVVHLLPMSKERKEGCCLMLIRASWAVAFLFAPWVRCKALGDARMQWDKTLEAMQKSDDEARSRGEEPRPLFILGNHTSFLDTLIAAGFGLPAGVLWRCRTYMDSALFKLPILATVCLCVGHFPVYFTSGDDGVFKVDTERMKKVDEKVDAHLRSGGPGGAPGWLCFFPEGQVNKTPDKILPFRYGGMKKALDFDARIVTFVCVGNQTVWPKKAQVGGFPGEVVYGTKPIALDGCKAMVAKARAEGLAEEKDLQDHEILARRAHTVMQAQYDEMKATMSVSAIKQD